MDIKMLQNVVDIVRSGFDSNGQPPHRQPAASEPALGNDHASSIFVVNHKEFNVMPSAQKQAIFRHRHILVRGIEPEHRTQFDATGLEALEDLDSPVSLQCLLPSSIFYVVFADTHVHVPARLRQKEPL